VVDGPPPAGAFGAPPPREAEAGGPGDRAGLVPLASETFELGPEAYRLVTFLNQALKDYRFVFGITLAEDGRICLRIYRVGGPSGPPLTGAARGPQDADARPGTPG